MFLFYTLMCRNHLEIGKNAKAALLVDSDFPEICPPHRFHRSTVWDQKTTSTENQFFCNVVWNFHSFHLSPRTAQSEVCSAGNPHFSEGQISDYGIPKVDVIDSNSYQTWIRPSHDFGTSLRIWEVPRKVLEMPKSHWIKGPSIEIGRASCRERVFRAV